MVMMYVCYIRISLTHAVYDSMSERYSYVFVFLCHWQCKCGLVGSAMFCYLCTRAIKYYLHLFVIVMSPCCMLQVYIWQYSEWRTY